MAGNITLDNLVSVSELSHGGVSKTLSRVGDNNPIVVMRNNKPAAIVISPVPRSRGTNEEGRRDKTRHGRRVRQGLQARR